MIDLNTVSPRLQIFLSCIFTFVVGLLWYQTGTWLVPVTFILAPFFYVSVKDSILYCNYLYYIFL